MRVGFGYDVHRLVDGRKLILGGVDIPFAKGLLGHSDADVLLHAIIDALLGAAAKGDIGMHFPDTNGKYKNISSIKLLDETNRLIKTNNYKISNIDCTIVAQKPKLAPYIEQMKVNISNTLRINIDQISIKATTTEGLGFTGTSKGIAAYAVVCIEENWLEGVFYGNNKRNELK